MSHTQTQVPAGLETATQIADQALLQLIQCPNLKPSEKLKALALFYKRHQIGGFAPRVSKTTKSEPQAQAVAAPASTDSPIPTATDSPTVTARVPISPPAQQHPAASFMAAGKGSNFSQQHHQRRR